MSSQTVCRVIPDGMTGVPLVAGQRRLRRTARNSPLAVVGSSWLLEVLANICTEFLIERRFSLASKDFRQPNFAPLDRRAAADRPALGPFVALQEATDIRLAFQVFHPPNQLSVVDCWQYLPASPRVTRSTTKSPKTVSEIPVGPRAGRTIRKRGECRMEGRV